MLRKVLRSLTRVYAVIDAADECNERARLIDTLRNICRWSLSGPRLLVTSRRERNIEDPLSKIFLKRVHLEESVVHTDIAVL